MTRKIQSTITTDSGEIFKVSYMPGFCFFSHEDYLIIDATNNVAIQTNSTEAKAQEAVEDLTNHERRCERNTEYIFQKIKSFTTK